MLRAALEMAVSQESYTECVLHSKIAHWAGCTYY